MAHNELVEDGLLLYCRADGHTALEQLLNLADLRGLLGAESRNVAGQRARVGGA